MSDEPESVRFDRHRHWLCSGRIDAVGDDIDEIEPRGFVVERSGDRWLLTDGTRLIVVGDAVRDLVSEGGGLVRQPAGQGFSPFWSAGLLRQEDMPRDLLTESATGSPREDTVNGRPTTFLDFVHPAGFTGTLGIDVETGIWVSLASAYFTITVDELVLDPEPSSAFHLLEFVPEPDLTGSEPVADELAAVVDAIREASGRAVLVRSQEPTTLEFDVVLVDDQSTPVGRITRSQAQQLQSRAHFPGSQAWMSDDDWEHHVDLSDGDPHRASRILDVIHRLV